MSTPWHDGLAPDDLPGDLHLVATECGMDVAVALAEKMGGVQIYITRADGLVSDKKKEYIIANFNGRNHKELAIATGWSERYIYVIIEEHRTEKKEAAKQGEMF